MEVATPQKGFLSWYTFDSEVQRQFLMFLCLVHFRPHLCHGYTDQYHSCKRSIITDCNLTTCLFAIGATPKEMQLNCHRGAVKELFLPYQNTIQFLHMLR